MTRMWQAGAVAACSSDLRRLRRGGARAGNAGYPARRTLRAVAVLLPLSSKPALQACHLVPPATQRGSKGV